MAEDPKKTSGTPPETKPAPSAEAAKPVDLTKLNPVEKCMVATKAAIFKKEGMEPAEAYKKAAALFSAKKLEHLRAKCEEQHGKKTDASTPPKPPPAE